MRNYQMLAIGAILISLIFSGCKTQDPKYDAFAQCLTDKGAVMYGTDWCPHCKAQKEMFGSSFNFVKYVNCDENRAACAGAGVEGYPTWVINNENHPGTQPMYRLAQFTGCSLGEE